MRRVSLERGLLGEGSTEVENVQGEEGNDKEELEPDYGVFRLVRCLAGKGCRDDRSDTIRAIRAVQ